MPHPNADILRLKIKELRREEIPKSAQHLIDSNITYNPYSSHIVWQNNKKRFLIRSGPQKKFFYLHSNLKQTKIRHIDSPNSFRFLYHKNEIFQLHHNHITNATNDKIKIALPVTNTNRIYFINKPEQPLCIVIDQSIWCLNQSKGNFEWELLTNKLPLQTIITAAAFNAKLHIWALGTQSDGLLIFKKNPFQILFPLAAKARVAAVLKTSILGFDLIVKCSGELKGVDPSRSPKFAVRVCPVI
jgi:hypothetical protein